MDSKKKNTTPAPYSSAPAERKRKRGRTPKPVADRRGHCVSVRLNPAELVKLDADRGMLQRGEWMRATFLGATPPPPPPAVNLTAWRALATAQSNLNQLARALNSDPAAAEVEAVLAEVRAFRLALIGAEK